MMRSETLKRLNRMIDGVKARRGSEFYVTLRNGTVRTVDAGGAVLLCMEPGAVEAVEGGGKGDGQLLYLLRGLAEV